VIGRFLPVIPATAVLRRQPSPTRVDARVLEDLRRLVALDPTHLPAELALVAATKNERFAWDCYRRFVQMYGDVVLGVQKLPGEDHEPFETVISSLKQERHNSAEIEDTKLSTDDLKELVLRFKALVKDRTGKAFPASPWDQLQGAIGAVFGSWMNDRAIVYRRKYNIPSEWGTAVNVQAMVYGNTGDTSGSGVAFTRNPANGTN